MRNNKAFTLVELLTVVTIVAILAAISLQVAGAVIGADREAKTKSTLWRLRVQTEHRQQALQRLQMRSTTCVDDTWEMLLVQKKLPNASLGTRRLLVKKLMLGRLFPQDRSEMWDAQLYPPGTSVEDALLRNSFAGDWTPDDGVTMVDGWGNPIAFYRWPTALFAAHPELLPGPYSKDPDDPLGSLYGLFVSGQPFDATMPIVMPDQGKPYVMIFVSPGPDGLLGLSGPLGAVTDEQAFSDDILSVQVF